MTDTDLLGLVSGIRWPLVLGAVRLDRITPRNEDVELIVFGDYRPGAVTVFDRHRAEVHQATATFPERTFLFVPCLVPARGGDGRQETDRADSQAAGEDFSTRYARLEYIFERPITRGVVDTRVVRFAVD